MLKIQVKDHTKTSQQKAIWVVEQQYTLGSDPSNNLVLIDDSISPHHASLITLNNKLYVKDNHSTHGSFVNGSPINKKEVVPGDVLRLGKVDILVMDPRESLNQDAIDEENLDNFWSLVADDSFLTGQEFYIHKSPCTVGRGSQCDIVLPGTHLSRQHAEIKIQGNLLHLRDLSSSNGTFVNGEKIAQGIARPGDQIKFDSYSFRVTGPEQDKNKTKIRISTTETERKSKTTDFTAKEKRWQTRPTSPGNRIELDTLNDKKGRQLASAFVLLAMASTLAYLVYPLLNQ